MKKTRKRIDIMQEFSKVEAACLKYGYRAFLRFDEIHIVSRCEAWYFIPNESGLIKLMHGNTMGQNPNGYHRQFYGRQMTYTELLTYINEHERGKYSNTKPVFTFTKTGGRKYA